MLFNSLEFLIFFPIVTLFYFVLPHKARWVWLLAASYYFYMCWDAKYALLLALSTAITYLSGLLIDRANRTSEGARRARLKKLWVALSFFSNLAILAFFKYSGFVSDNLAALFGALGLTYTPARFSLVLPVGISFYTFQALSYTMDVYRGDVYAERNPFKYALFVSFFPQLVAGPIERSKNLLVQVGRRHAFDPDRVRDGLLLMLWGLFQKIVIADRAAYVVNHVFENWQTASGAALVMGVVLFAVQIYGDFAGYSDVAIGAAQVMGFQLMDNFKQPYLAQSCAEFWRRWHISLSSWFRDYLYIPLGGNRKGTGRKYLNLMVTFFASGLWHGADWSFVMWGVLNGAYQVAGDVTRPARDRLCRALHISRAWPVMKAARVAITFCLIDFAWLFFRADSMSQAVGILARLWQRLCASGVSLATFTSAGGLRHLGLDLPNLAALAVVIGILIAADLAKERRPLRPVITARPLPVRWAVYLAGIYALLIFGMYGPGFNASQFIYFQF